MTSSALPFILDGSANRSGIDFENLTADQAKVAARFWVGKYVGSQAKAECIKRIFAIWEDPARTKQILSSLRPQQRAALGVINRFGGSIPGSLLKLELAARGLIPEEDENGTIRSDYLENQRTHPVFSSCLRLILFKHRSAEIHFGGDQIFPDVSLPRQLDALVEPVKPLGWKASRPLKQVPEIITKRATVEMLIDLEQTARVFESQKRWKTGKGGGLTGALRRQLAKLRPPNENNPLDPPDCVALGYFLLVTLGAIECDDGQAQFHRKRADELFHESLQVQVSDWIRAWISMRLWQDGLGAVPERDGGTTRIVPKELKRSRQALVWALTRVAHNDDHDWLDLENFLLDYYQEATAKDYRLSYDYWYDYAWKPDFSLKWDNKDPSEEALWINNHGIWAANALLSTLVYLGVVERGKLQSNQTTRWCFRLTDIGKAVFGAPEIRFEGTSRLPSGDCSCLTVQPNHDVLLYLDVADNGAITKLSRIAWRESATGLVQTFKLTRSSVHNALEAGMTEAEIRSFLVSSGRSTLPANVAQSIAEWARKRETLTVRSEVALQFLPGTLEHRGRSLGSGLWLTSLEAANEAAATLGIKPESKTPSKDWSVNEHGVVSPTRPMSPMSIVGKARLQRFARCIDGIWRISAESVRAARESGIDADQILAWLAEHAIDEIPPILIIAIKNWWSGKDPLSAK